MHDLKVAGNDLGHFWHCFGTARHHKASLEMIIALLKTSRTSVLPINTHRLDAGRDRSALEHGFSRVSYDELAAAHDITEMTKMLNINLRTSAEEAIETAKLAHDMTGDLVLKLEVLTEDHKESSDVAVLDAAETLLIHNPDFVVLPLLTNNYESVVRAREIGCGLVRVMGSPIGSRQGIADQDEFIRVVDTGIPVVLDGGIGQTEHIRQAAALGAQGVLVNSVLFDSGENPVSTMAAMRQAADESF